MKPGASFQTGEYDQEILRSGDFQLISITLDSTATYDPDGSGATAGVTKIPKGTLLCKSTDLSDGTYEVVSTLTGELGTKQLAQHIVVLAETILDASAQDQPVKAYWAGTFDWSKIKYTNSSSTPCNTTSIAACMGRLKFVDFPS